MAREVTRPDPVGRTSPRGTPTEASSAPETPTERPAATSSPAESLREVRALVDAYAARLRGGEPIMSLGDAVFELQRLLQPTFEQQRLLYPAASAAERGRA